MNCHFFFFADSGEFPTYVDDLNRVTRSADDYEYDQPIKRGDDHLLRFARRLNYGNPYDDIFAKRGGDDHFLRFAKSYLIRGARDQTNEHMLRFAKRSVEEPDQPSADNNDDHLLRFAKKSGDDHFLRFA